MRKGGRVDVLQRWDEATWQLPGKRCTDMDGVSKLPPFAETHNSLFPHPGSPGNPVAQALGSPSAD